MTRWPATLAAFLLAVLALAGQPAFAPAPAAACSCMPTTLADYAADPEVSVFTGRAGQQVVDRIPVAVSAWFKGRHPVDIAWIGAADVPDGRGNVVSNTCGIYPAPGEEWLFIVYGQPPDVYSASNCTPSSPLIGPDGEATVADAAAVFGAPRPPPAPASPRHSADPSATGPSTGSTAGWVWLAGGVAASLLVLAAVALLAIRRRPLS